MKPPRGTPSVLPVMPARGPEKLSAEPSRPSPASNSDAALTPTPEQLADLAARVLAVFRRPPRGGALDNAAAEVAILIGGLCPTLAEAKALTEQLLTHVWDRWDYAGLRLYALQCRGLAPKGRAAAFGIGPTSTTAEECGLAPEEFQALHAYALKAGLVGEANGQRRVYVGDAFNAVHENAEAFLDALPEAEASRLLDLSRQDFRDYMAVNFPWQHRRTLEPPFLDRNARDIAVERAYYHLLLHRPLLEPWPTRRCGKARPAAVPEAKPL